MCGEQLDLEAYARNTDPETSKRARDVIKKRLTGLESAVVDALRHSGDMTTKEIGGCISEPRDTVSPRMAPLVRRGLVEKTKERRDGCIVWGATTMLPEEEP